VASAILFEERRCQSTDVEKSPRRTAQTVEDRFGVREEQRRAQEDRAGLPDLDRRQRSKPRKEEERLMRAAIYARVSTPRQGREQTIESQLAALKSWAGETGHELSPENVYTDEGYSGSRLDRPGLDALRDGAEDGSFEVVGVLSPDRLARKYAYQVLLLEEFRRSGCEIMFVDHPISDDPNDQLLLQIQGAIAEYERALLGERFRRGKLQKAREGHFIGGRAPYGYRYVAKRDGVSGHLVVDETESEIVRMLYGWLIEERMTVRQILKRLNEGPWFPRSGGARWSASVVHRILSDPVYTGTAYANRYRYVPPERPRARGPRTGENTCRKFRPKEEWIPIHVPPIIDEETRRLAQDQLKRNARLSFRNNKRYSYLLRCLLSCESCGLAMYGTTYKATDTQPERRYYQCHGKDPILSAREHKCLQRPAKARELEEAVWEYVKEVMRDPERLLTQFEDFACSTSENGDEEDAEAKKFEGHLKRLYREQTRLVDAYQAEIIELEELKERRAKIAQRRKALRAQYEQQAQWRRQAAQAREVLEDLESFCRRINARLDDATFEEKQSILQLLIERIIDGEDTLEIRHVIPLDGPPRNSRGSAAPPESGLRSDGVNCAALPLGAKQLARHCSLYPLMVVRDHQAHS
jgi:site-specific DNA recombinase